MARLITRCRRADFACCTDCFSTLKVWENNTMLPLFSSLPFRLQRVTSAGEGARRSSQKYVRVAGAAACLAGGLATLTGCHRGAATTGAADVSASRPATVAAKAIPAAVPLPALPPNGIRGIYLTGWTAGLHNRLNTLCGICDRTDINAMVIDVKDDGQLSYNMDIPLARDAHASLKMYDVDKVIATLNAHHIWPIARIACMRDTPLAKAHPELAVHGPDGQIWHDRSKHYWLNPYKKEVWDYNVDVALDAIRHGFKEIQFDYVRFPSEGKISTLQYPGRPEGALRADQIAAFMKYAEDKVHANGGWFSADVFGLVATVERRHNRLHPEDAPAGQMSGGAAGTAGMSAMPKPGMPAVAGMTPNATSPAGVATSANGDKTANAKTPAKGKPKTGGTDRIAQDMGIGQIFTHLAAHTDYMSPMCYPSHYAHGEFGIANPNAEPYQIIMKSVGDSKTLIAGVPHCKLRPWIQDFTLGPPHYGPTEVKAQIKALHDLGINEYLLWNAGCKYTEAAYTKKTGATPASTGTSPTPKTTASATP